MCLVLDNAKLVYHIAGKYPTYARLSFEDRVQEGFIGLINAVRTYKEGDVPFSAYAAAHIDWAIKNALRREYPVKITSHVSDILNYMKRHKLENPTAEDLMKRTGRGRIEVETAIEYSRSQKLSLDYELEDKTTTVYNFIGVDEDFETDMLLENCLQAVPERYRETFHLKIKGYALEEIAEILNIPLKKVRSNLQSARNNVRPKKKQLIGV